MAVSAVQTLHCLKCDNIVTSQYSCKHMSPIKSSCVLARNVFFTLMALNQKGGNTMFMWVYSLVTFLVEVLLRDIYELFILEKGMH